MTALILRFTTSIYKVEQRSSIVTRIFLRPENFAKIEDNSLPLKMFKDLFLSGGIAFDVGALLQTQTPAGDF